MFHECHGHAGHFLKLLVYLIELVHRQVAKVERYVQVGLGFSY